jgi:predicted dehydrogenase
LTAARVGLIGARRRRQGLGPFVARDLVAAGASVPCFLGTSEETLEAARRELEERAGVVARGYVDVDQMLAREALDAVAILSPAETHEVHLDSALAAGLHVLCEKPFVWGGRGLASRAADWTGRFSEAGLLIRENCQWPYTLPAFGELHPEALDESPTHFSMRLSPASSGVQMLGDSLPHALSLLQSLAPGDDASVESPRFSRASSSAASLRVEFSYRTSGAAVAAEVDLIPSDAFPRPAGYGVNGRWAERKVDAADYSIAFAAGGREVPVQDPLGLRIEAFVRELESVRHAETGPQALEIVQRMELLESLVLAWERDFGD